MSVSFEEFEKYYNEKGRCLNDVSIRKNLINKVQLKKKYQKYLSSEEKRKARVLREIKKEIDNKERNDWYIIPADHCVLVEKILELNYFDDLVKELHKNAGKWFYVYDRAHIIAKGSNRKMMWDKDNIIPLNHWSHMALDNFKDPITGSSISKEERDHWWRFLVGVDKFEELSNRAKKY